MNKLLVSKLALLLAYSTFVYGLLAIPFSEHVGEKQFTLYDKGFHGILFFFFSFLCIYFYKELKRNDSEKQIYFLVFCLTVLFILLGEYTQYFIPGRDTSFGDSLGGIIGALVGIFFSYLTYYKFKPKLLLHICCIGCGIYLLQKLEEDYDITLYFYNPNIYPKGEYTKRLEEINKISQKYKIKIVLGKYEHAKWKKTVKGHEEDKERGERCLICYKMRLSESAKYAQKNNFSYFTTTLSISPHKNAQAIIEFGIELERKHNVKFIDEDFKKNDGFKKSAQLSKDLGLYRQNYCGCEYSIRK